jgi:hypothetical protein
MIDGEDSRYGSLEMFLVAHAGDLCVESRCGAVV